jgi:hypothetical protein
VPIPECEGGSLLIRGNIVAYDAWPHGHLCRIDGMLSPIAVALGGYTDASAIVIPCNGAWYSTALCEFQEEHGALREVVELVISSLYHGSSSFSLEFALSPGTAHGTTAKHRGSAPDDSTLVTLRTRGIAAKYREKYDVLSIA